MDFFSIQMRKSYTAKVTQPSFFAKYQKVGGTSGTVSDEITKCEFKEQIDRFLFLLLKE